MNSGTAKRDDGPESAAIPAVAAAFEYKRWSAVIGAVVSVTILAVALWFLHGELAGLSWDSVVAHIRSIPAWVLALSVALTACSYITLTGYDAVALRYLNRDLPFRRVALTAFMAYAVGHNVGLVALSGGSIRYRMYSLAGLPASDIARLIVFVTATFGIGVSGLLGLALLSMPANETAILRLPSIAVTLAGLVLLAAPVLYTLISVLRREPVRIGELQIAVPGPAVAARQIAVSVADLMFAAAALYVLLEPQLHIGYLQFLGIYLIAIAAALVTSVPGGIGVIEAVLLVALPDVDRAALLGTVIIYRLIYYVAPLTLALAFLVGHEIRQHGEILDRAVTRAGDWLGAIAPQLLGLVTFFAGVILLVSGATPAIESRMAVLAKVIPLPLLEISHLTGSVIGTCLLILARGLYRRRRGALVATCAALVAGIVVSLAKGLDYEEASILGGVLLVLWLSRREFYRLDTVSADRFPARWVAAIVMAMILMIWLTHLSASHVEYSNQLWWQFAVDADAPRALRAMLIAGVTALSFAIWKALHGRPGDPAGIAEGSETDLVEKVIAGARHSSANVALLGDKRILWSADRQAFIMYQVSGRSWVALGDPVGPESHYADLAWEFRELVDQHDGRTVFYEVSDKHLSLYIDLGLALSKLGEEGRVALQGYSLKGSDRAALRQAVNKATRNGATFEVVASTELPAIMERLRSVSDSWLRSKSSAEMGFSLGAFSERYMEHFDCALVRVDGEIVAFANLWKAPAGAELSIDLMRYDDGAPKGVMDFLFAELMLWGSANGYQWFSLGMAPLSGLENRFLAPFWHKLGHFAFSHGEHFYNFEGLRSYKSKFDPEWQPRYLACPGGWTHLAASIFDVTRLIRSAPGEVSRVQDQPGRAQQPT